MTLRDATPIPSWAFRLLCTDRDRTPLEDNEKSEAHTSKEKVLLVLTSVIQFKYIISVKSKSLQFKTKALINMAVTFSIVIELKPTNCLQN